MKNSDYFGIIFFRKKFDIRDSAIEIPQLGTKTLAQCFGFGWRGAVEIL